MGLLDAILIESIRVGIMSNMRPMVAAVAGVQQTTLTGPDEIGCFPFDPSKLAPPSDSGIVRSIVFTAVLNVTTAGQTATLELYNKTDGALVATLTGTSTTPTEVSSSALAVPTAIPNSRKLYGVRLKRTGGATTDAVVCKYAALEITFA
jgi:hypothetical protein